MSNCELPLLLLHVSNQLTCRLPPLSTVAAGKNCCPAEWSLITTGRLKLIPSIDWMNSTSAPVVLEAWSAYTTNTSPLAGLTASDAKLFLRYVDLKLNSLNSGVIATGTLKESPPLIELATKCCRFPPT